MKKKLLTLFLAVIALSSTSQTAFSQDRKFCFNEQQVDSIIQSGFNATAYRIAYDSTKSAYLDLNQTVSYQQVIIEQSKETIQAKDDNERYQERVIADQMKENRKLENKNWWLRTGLGVAIGALSIKIIKDL